MTRCGLLLFSSVLVVSFFENITYRDAGGWHMLALFLLLFFFCFFYALERHNFFLDISRYIE